MAKENPNAFPSVETGYGKVGEKYDIHHDGMTLRDYFAAKAMQGLLANPTIDNEMSNSDLASVAYGISDKMLEERSKGS